MLIHASQMLPKMAYGCLNMGKLEVEEMERIDVCQLEHWIKELLLMLSFVTANLKIKDFVGI